MPDTDPIIPRADIESAIAKVKAYISEGKAKPGDTAITPANWYGKLLVYATLPESLAIGGDNKNEVAALVRALRTEDPELTTQIVSFTGKAKQPVLNIHTEEWVGWNGKEYNRDEAKRLEKQGEDFKGRLATALKKIANADPKELADRIENDLAKEQKRVNEAYERARDGVKDAFKKNDHVGVLVDRAYSYGYMFQYLGAIDGAEDSGKFGAKATGKSKIEFDLPDTMTAEYNLKGKASTHVYFDAVKRAYTVQQNGEGDQKVAGILNFRDTTPNRDDVLTNEQKRAIGIGLNKQNYAAVDAHNAATQGAILTLNSDLFLFPKDATVLTAIHHISTNKNHVKYYASRYNDASENGPRSEKALLKHYAHPGHDISGKAQAQEILYFSQEMGTKMYEQAKEAYLSKSVEKEKRFGYSEVHADDELASLQLPKRAAQQVIRK